MVNARATLDLTFRRADALPVDWQTSTAAVPYVAAMARMDARVRSIADKQSRECVWLLEHPALYTAGTSTSATDVLDARFDVHQTGRGGQLTYHGPGQRVAYVMMDLGVRGADVRRFVGALERWIITALASFGIQGETREDRVGVWVRRPDKGRAFEDKVAAIGIRVRRWVTLHGFSINVNPDLGHFAGIVPCGIADSRFGVTSLADLGLRASIADLDAALDAAFPPIFGPLWRLDSVTP